MQLTAFERGRIIGLREAIGQIGETLVIWVKAMRLLKDAGNPGGTLADFSIMMLAIDQGPQQIKRTERSSDQL